MKVGYPKLKSIKWKNGALAENVAAHPNYLSINIPADNIIKGVQEIGLRDIVVFGYDYNDEEHIFSNQVRYENTAYMFARGQLAMLRNEDD